MHVCVKHCSCALSGCKIYQAFYFICVPGKQDTQRRDSEFKVQNAKRQHKIENDFVVASLFHKKIHICATAQICIFCFFNLPCRFAFCTLHFTLQGIDEKPSPHPPKEGPDGEILCTVQKTACWRFSTPILILNTYTCFASASAIFGSVLMTVSGVKERLSIPSPTRNCANSGKSLGA